MSGAPYGSPPPVTDRRPHASAPWTVALAHSVAQRTGPRRLVALLAPAFGAAALAPARESIDVAAVVLLFALLVVAVAASGDRVAGLIACVSTAAWLDFFLLPPYFTFRIGRGEDVILALLFALVGLAVTELALRGRRQAAEVARRSGYVDGILQVLRIDPDQASGHDRQQAICREITRVLGIDSCRYVEAAPAGGCPILHDTGEISQAGTVVDVSRNGLPTTSEIAIPVRRGDLVVGHFALVSATRVRYPRTDELKVAVLLADQAAQG
ncbi:MAG: DUF4118 domain-containing protein [Austwickia sp.]|nr:DUF4118 domain-containing protein [Actinomycetota bacterium]MCO5310495.1 DUF4118 domain-containing protein [Austwickia sp.]